MDSLRIEANPILICLSFANRGERPGPGADISEGKGVKRASCSMQNLLFKASKASWLGRRWLKTSCVLQWSLPC